jgi:hypothetical protein
MFRNAFLSICIVLAVASGAAAQDEDARLKTLEERSRAQEEQIAEQRKRIQTLEESRETAPPPETAPAREDGSISAKATGLFGGSFMTNPYISLIVNAFYYGSNLSQEELDSRTVPGFSSVPLATDKGFNLESAELMLFAPVDPYFNLYATIPIATDGAEVEEAYFVTSSLPAGFQVKGGRFLSGFGRINNQHPHSWDFYDVPLNYRAILGPDAMGGQNGIQLTCLPPLPVYLQLGVEALQGVNDLLFYPDNKDGPHAFTAFAKTSVDIGDSSTVLLGASFVTGQAKLFTIEDGTVFTGNTNLYDLELVYKWKPSRGRSFVLQGEYLYRKQKGTLFQGDTPDPSVPQAPLERSQDGLYVQGLYQIDRWRIGARYGVLDLFSEKYTLDGVPQDFGQKPWQVAAALEFNPSEFSRLRLQYNHDLSAGTGQANNEVILQVILGIGAHAAHSF